MTNRILVAGVPRAGKTTFGQRLSMAYGLPLRSTDDLIASHGWSDASAEAARWIAAPAPWVIEGVAVPRALRKWLAAHPEGAPADMVVWMPDARVALTKGQAAMGKGVATVWAEILPELGKRGITVGTVEEITAMARRAVAS